MSSAGSSRAGPGCEDCEMTDGTRPTPDAVALVRGHLLEAMSLIDELEKTMRPWARSCRAGVWR